MKHVSFLGAGSWGTALEMCIRDRYTNRTAQIGQYGFWNNETNIGWTDSTSELYNYDNNQNGKEASALTGMMLKLSDNSNLTSKYVKLSLIHILQSSKGA